MPRADLEWLSWTNSAVMPASAKVRAFQLSKKNPRESPSTLGPMSLTLGSRSLAVTINFALPLQDTQQILAVAALHERGGHRFQLPAREKSLGIGDLFRASDLETLPVLDDADEFGRLDEGGVGTGVEPGEAPPHDVHRQFSHLQVTAVEIGYLELTSRGRPNIGGDVNHFIVVKV